MRNGSHDATTDPERVAEWWRRWPEANVGVATGAGLVVLDVDPRHGGDESLHELERKHGELPRTVSVVTGSGGAHYYFAASGIRNSAAAVAPGLDVRGAGGLVVAPGSLHESGRHYEWDRDPDEAPLAPLPAWLQVRKTAQRKPRPVSEWRRLAAEGAREGERNERTAQLAGHLLARDVDPHVTLGLLVAWDAKRNRPPLGADEVTNTVASIARREVEKWQT